MGDFLAIDARLEDFFHGFAVTADHTVCHIIKKTKKAAKGLLRVYDYRIVIDTLSIPPKSELLSSNGNFFRRRIDPELKME